MSSPPMPALQTPRESTPTPLPQTPPPMSSQATVPDSPPGSKRPADPQDSDISDLIHKAKASRFSAPPPTANEEESIEELLAKQLLCSICTELYVDPVLVLPCSHSFCGSCAARWLQFNNTCPSCRGKVVETRPNTSAAEMSEVLLKKFPEKARPAEELEELKRFYKPGDKITIHVPSYSSEDEEEDEEDDWAADNSNFNWLPCPTCPSDNQHGYTCPDPIPPAESERGHRYYGTSFHDHVKCNWCERPTPTGWKPYKCSLCSETYCGNMFDCTANQLENYMAPVPEQTYSGSQPNGWRKFNNFEKNRFTVYVAENEISWATIWTQVKEHILTVAGTLRRDQIICRRCYDSHLEYGLMNWWIWFQERNGIVDNRVKCWYGLNCRTQRHNDNHAARLNHACWVTPEAERVSNAPPRDSVPIPHPGGPRRQAIGSASGSSTAPDNAAGPDPGDAVAAPDTEAGAAAPSPNFQNNDS
ncbi:hypothetical protein FN846DRAFT_104393 [Sphaerosporella brunnea]|uniref:RING-type domain-containing protein n=1 Tax=Sphaerosporella brunnea TaxID=1250544 RepID=A0A5J5ETM1_9PEZI|nr:hypothetical protein FN846DRAFT_104393 [Sphaerosporella brunnea]